MISQKQLSLADTFEDYKDIFESDKPQFLTLLEPIIVFSSIPMLFKPFHSFLQAIPFYFFSMIILMYLALCVLSLTLTFEQ